MGEAHLRGASGRGLWEGLMWEGLMGGDHGRGSREGLVGEFT